ncbi:MAG: CDP-glycerol glycerophosphotransferase family protein [Eubacterium sp.]|nr:CDP-glycerol glycerophosphotransferase family protein [Eubacterium sp.]
MFLYIDPGTGSMLFTILIGIIGTLAFFFKTLIVKLKFVLTGGKKTNASSERESIVIFSDDKRYWSVFKPICREFNKRNIKVKYFTASENDDALKNEFENIEAEFIGENNKAFSKLNFLDAKLVLSTTPGLDVYQWKRSKKVNYYLHIPHAASDISLYRMFGIDYYDGVLLSGEYQVDEIRRLESARNLPAKDIEVVGIPYMDDMLDRLKMNSTVKSDIKTVLLAPSWGSSSIFSKYGSRVIEELTKTGYHIIIRPHPQSFISEAEMINELMIKYPDSDLLEWNRDADNFNVLNKSDILISDFSGVIFDFALVYDKPVIYTDTEFDKSPYDAWWIDDELWTISALPKIGEKLDEDNLSNIKDLIDNCMENNIYSQNREQLRTETWANIGAGAEKTVDFIINKLNEID